LLPKPKKKFHTLNFSRKAPVTNPAIKIKNKEELIANLVYHVDGDEVVSIFEEEHVVVQYLVEQLNLNQRRAVSGSVSG
jgi:hypothetical protein